MKHKFTFFITTGVLALFLLAFSACKKAPQPINPNPNPAPAGNFTSLEVHGSVNVILSPDTINKATSTLSGNVVYNYQGHTLILSGSGIAAVSIKALDALTVTGSANVVNTDTLRMDQLAITSHGSSTIDLKLIVKNNLAIKVTGSSDNYTLAGNCPKIATDISGSPNIHAYSLVTNDCAVAMNGSGNCEVYSTNSLSADLTGSSILYYKGNPPTVNTISITGTSKLVKQ